MDIVIHNPDHNTSGCEIGVFFLFPSPPYKKVSLEKRELWVTQMQVSNPVSCNVLCNALGFYLGHAPAAVECGGSASCHWNRTPCPPVQSRVLLCRGQRWEVWWGLVLATLLCPISCIQGYARECLYCVHKLFQFFSTRREKVIFPTLVMGKWIHLQW